jgi:hypothetical protein
MEGGMKKVIIIFAVLVAAIAIIVGYSGIFYSVRITEKEIGPFTMILKKHTGSYYKSGETFKQVNAELKKVIDTTKLAGVGLYYDDPAKVKEENLRSECGFILERTDLAKIAPLKKTFIIKNFRKTLCIVGEFPIRTYLSYMIGPSRVYPKLEEYANSRKYKTDYGMEIYDMQSKKILYCMPVINKK